MKQLFFGALLAFVLPGEMRSQPPAGTAGQNPLASKVASAASTIAERHAQAAEAMQVSIDKQKAALRLQVGAGGASDSFFTTAWVTPQVITLPPQCAPMEEADLTPLVKEAALAQDLDAGLIRAIIRRESASVSCAVSVKGAVGLMQLMPDTAQKFGVDPYDAKQNIQAGSKYLKELLTRYKGDRKLALAAYNAGPGRVDEAGGVPAIPETAEYVEAILREVAAVGSAAVAAPERE
jgi:soluble lytic murein transglycosylase-like protein